MFTSRDFKVELLNIDDVKKFVKNHGMSACVCYNTDEKYAESVGKSVLKTGHLSGSRGDYFKFKFTVVPRDMVDQSTRHDVGSYKQVQSFRYVEKKGVNLYVPPEVEEIDELMEVFANMEKVAEESYNKVIDIFTQKGYKGEYVNQIARHLLPIGSESAFVMGFSLEALMNFMNKRLCTCAEYPIRTIAKQMRNEVLKVAPIYEEYLVPICEKNLWCPEDKKRSCGRKPIKAELENIINNQ